MWRRPVPWLPATPTASCTSPDRKSTCRTRSTATTKPVYVQGQKNLAEFIRRGVLVQEERDCFYVYRQRMGAITQTGLVVCASVDDYQSGVIKKHEHTRADKEEDRVKHIDYLDANDEPVFYLSRSCGEVEGIIEGVTNGHAGIRLYLERRCRPHPLDHRRQSTDRAPDGTVRSHPAPVRGRRTPSQRRRRPGA